MKREKRILAISISMNIVLWLDLLFVLYKAGYMSRILQNRYSYLDNPNYAAMESQFELYSENCNVIFAGDSITQNGRWNELFPDVLSLNRGIGSDTTEGLYNRLDEILCHNPSKIFIMIGINDIGVGVPIQDSIDFMEKIILLKENSPECTVYI